jgi:hypothetical protein
MDLRIPQIGTFFRLLDGEAGDFGEIAQVIGSP